MVHPELVSYLAEQTQQGVSADTLRQALMESGWKEVDIDNALHDVVMRLDPATPGASIHGDLAQVRGMVAHLAGRVGRIEARLASATDTLPMLGTELALPPLVRHRSSRIRHITALAVAAGVFIAAWQYTGSLVAQYALAPMDQVVIITALGLAMAVAGYVAMRLSRAWVASLLTDSGLALCALTGTLAYRSYHYLEGATALALGLLVAVLVVVMERWIDRLSSV